MSQSLRDYLALLSQRGQLNVIDESVDAEFDLAAVLSLTEDGPATRFDRVKDSSYPVVGNVVNSRERVALALGVGQEEISEALTGSIAKPLPTRLLESGPCQEIIEDLAFGALPIPRFFEQETGRYITAGVILATDLSTGVRNMSFARFKILDETRAMLGVSPNHHLGKMAKRAAELGEPFPIAVAIGTHPAIMIAACLYLGFGDDELECAGRLLGEPIDVVKATQSDNLVPADAEMVLEGFIKPGETIEEGLVSEFHGHHHDYGPGLIVEFTKLTRRREPLFQTILPGLHQEHLLLGAVAIASGLRSQLQRIVPQVVDVAVPLTGAGRTTAVVSTRSLTPGQSRQLMMACFSSVSLIKQVTVVDSEIDPWNTDAVEWARVFHARTERDYLMIPDARTDRSDPLSRNLTIGKVGIDATAKPGDRAEGWSFARPPLVSRRRAEELLSRAGLPASTSPLVAGIRYTESPI